MESIRIEFSGHPRFMPSFGIPTVILTLDENGKHFEIDRSECIRFDIELNKKFQEKLGCIQPVTPNIPKRILKAFTASAVSKILEKDEIPSNPEIAILDGGSYDIVITKGSCRKEYHCGDDSIDTYPLLRYLASWYNKK